MTSIEPAQQYVRVLTIADAGHNLQHDQPEQVAAVLEDFLCGGAS